MAKPLKPETSFVPYPAPAFDLPASDGAVRSLSAMAGQWFILFLYPKDDTLACTQEARDFSAALPEFAALGVAVLGLSRDSLKAHAKFIAKYGLKMPLLSDEDTSAIDAFGAWGEKMLYGRVYLGTERSTFLIDPQGVVRRAWRQVKVKAHVQEVLNVTKTLLRGE